MAVESSPRALIPCVPGNHFGRGIIYLCSQVCMFLSLRNKVRYNTAVATTSLEFRNSLEIRAGEGRKKERKEICGSRAPMPYRCVVVPSISWQPNHTLCTAADSPPTTSHAQHRPTKGACGSLAGSWRPQ